MLIELVTWWYGAGWLDTLQRIQKRILGIWRLFSVGILARTLFAPWRRIVSTPGRGLDSLMRSMIDNLVSRVVGFTVRIFVLVGALLATFIALVVGAAIAVLWPLVPVIAIFCLYKGILG
jgi:hypothetical protein